MYVIFFGAAGAGSLQAFVLSSYFADYVGWAHQRTTQNRTWALTLHVVLHTEHRVQNFIHTVLKSFKTAVVAIVLSCFTISGFYQVVGIESVGRFNSELLMFIGCLPYYMYWAEFIVFTQWLGEWAKPESTLMQFVQPTKVLVCFSNPLERQGT